MPTPADFFVATKWAGIATLALMGLSGLAFALGWGIRFRLVGAAGFAVVLTVGLLGLSFEPFTRTVVPGAVAYSTVYDSGASRVVITVPPTISPEALEATLRQAASNLFKPYRLGLPNQGPTIRARTIVHDQDQGISKLVYLGQVQPGNGEDTADHLIITIHPEVLAELPSASHS